MDWSGIGWDAPVVLEGTALKLFVDPEDVAVALFEEAANSGDTWGTSSNDTDQNWSIHLIKWNFTRLTKL